MVNNVTLVGFMRGDRPLCGFVHALTKFGDCLQCRLQAVAKYPVDFD